MAPSVTDGNIPCEITHLDEFIEAPSLYVYPDGQETVLGVTGLENVVEIVLNRQQLAALLDELEEVESVLIATEGF